MLVAWSLGLGLGANAAWLGTGLLLCPCCIGFLLLALTPKPTLVSEGQACGKANRIVLFAGAFLFVYVAMEVSYGGYLASFAKRHLLLGAAEAAHMNSVYWAMLCC